jgi:hypothetical protein
VNHAQILINAVQSCDPQQVEAAITTLNALSDARVAHLKGSERLWNRRSHINDRLPGPLDVTALHVAAKAYAVHHQDLALAAVFNEMVANLLAAGAMPTLEVGARDMRHRVNGHETFDVVRGQTVVELCDGHLPPALKAWCEEHWSDDKTVKPYIKSHPITVRRDQVRVAQHRVRNPVGRAIATPDAEMDQSLGFVQDDNECWHRAAG